ncbi:MAG: ComF family protein [Sedimentisphaerales bacterium]|nr:ComF family protein [Sedimentisphaerales bacterium]
MPYNRVVDLIGRKPGFGDAAKMLWHGLNHIIWPDVCMNCAETICRAENGLCRSCWAELLEATAADYCPRCGKNAGKYALVGNSCPDCSAKQYHFDAIARAGVYDASLRDMIIAFKRGATELGPTLGKLADSALQGREFANKIDFFVPVPLHWSRRLTRGYNQSLLLARSLNRRRARINTDLVRIRPTKFQPTMPSDAARVRNVKDAFAVRRRHSFASRNICLVDDIKTTGATLSECAKTLKNAGAAHVYAIVLSVAHQQR